VASFEWEDTVRVRFPGGALPRSTVDAVVVGAGPAGSTAAFVLARGGARAVLVDKAMFGREKACGDLVGPGALALLGSLGLAPAAGRAVGAMMVVGPTGRRVLLPARAGRTYPDHGSGHHPPAL
jgi:flavin-dependent dehydrogenase